MREIIRQYGSMAVAIVVMGMLLTLILASMAVISVIPDSVGGEGLDQEYIGNSYDNWRQSGYLDIKYNWKSQLECGQQVMVSELIKVCDSGGNPLKCTVNYILDEAGNQYSVRDKDEGQYFYFEQAGIYQVYICADSKNGRRRYGKLRLPVNSRRRQS